MNDSVRRAVAYIVGRVSGGTRGGSVYDHVARKAFNFSGTVSATSASIFDFDARCHVTGSRTGNKIALYHYGARGHVDLVFGSGNAFRGYDYSSATHYSGALTGRTVDIYDYRTAKHYQYSV